jgi:prevent-host-death family protein
MKEVGLFDAKTNLSKIAEQVRRTGEPVTLTKRGEPYVDIVPHRRSKDRRSRKEIFADWRRLRAQLPKISSEEIKSAIEEGRR